MGGIVVLVAALLALIVRDRPPGMAPLPAAGVRLRRSGGLAVLRRRELWPILPIAFTGYAVLVTVRGLWAGPYLADVFGLGPVERGNASARHVGRHDPGHAAYGNLERRIDRRRIRR